MTHTRLPAKNIIASLQGREALYIEHGALFVRPQIDINFEEELLECKLVEIPTAGFEHSFMHRLERCINPATNLLEFSVGFISGAGKISPDYIGTCGGISFDVYFDPTLLDIVKNLGRRWTDDQTPFERYQEVGRVVFDYLRTFDPMPIREKFDINEFM